MHNLTFYCFLVFLAIISSSVDFDIQTTLPSSYNTISATTITPYRYNRLIFFFFSENVTLAFLEEIVFEKLSEFDNYCGGEDFRTVLLYGSEKEDDWLMRCEFCPLEKIFGMVFAPSVLQASHAKNISAGGIDQNDVNNVSATLIQYISVIENYSLPLTTTQMILITDYVTDSLLTPKTTHFLMLAKSLKIKLIALTTNLTDERVNKYFPPHIWNVSSNYISWSPENSMANPICGYTAQIYTTPSQSFNGELKLRIFLYLSYDFVNGKNLNEVIDLLGILTQRRWLYPCSQYRFMQFSLNLPYNDTQAPETTPCYLEKSAILPSSQIKLCSAAFFRAQIEANDWRNNFKTKECNSAFVELFHEILDADDFSSDKFLVITDVSQFCHDYSSTINEALKNYSDFSSGAPITVIAIENQDDSSVSSSYAPIFPPTQRPNLHKVRNLTEFMMTIDKTVNFCLNSVPWLDVVQLGERTIVPHYRTTWHLYLIGAAILTALTATFLFMKIRRNKKRREHIRQIRDRRAVVTTTDILRNLKEYKFHQAIQDDWEVPLKHLKIDFINLLGKGAYSVVYSEYSKQGSCTILSADLERCQNSAILGFLHGKAPVLSIFPSIALQQFVNCKVAVKTLPQHSSESDKKTFRNEIQLMKGIGYHVHLISILGCNISIERPILLMELMKQDLLHWLASVIVEPNLEKTLLSVAWQVSDGMSYLSSNKFIHRDLAARNVLLNSEMKAMVSDFGLCRKIEDTEEVLTIPGGMLPLKWMALESLLKHQFSLKSDVWSFGVLLFEIFSLGQELYTGVSDGGLITFLREGNRLEQPRLADEQTYALMNKCWQMDPAQRPDFLKIQSRFTEMLEGLVAKYGYLDAAEDI